METLGALISYSIWCWSIAYCLGLLPSLPGWGCFCLLWMRQRLRHQVSIPDRLSLMSSGVLKLSIRCLLSRLLRVLFLWCWGQLPIQIFCSVVWGNILREENIYQKLFRCYQQFSYVFNAIFFSPTIDVNRRLHQSLLYLFLLILFPDFCLISAYLFFGICADSRMRDKYMGQRGSISALG